MDHFGIGSGVAGATQIYFQSSRRTGRTKSLVDSLKDGDRVVFLSSREGRRVKELCKERGVSIEVIVSDAKSLERLLSRGSPSGDKRTVFDHSWVEQFYMNAIERAAADIDHFQTIMSGNGEEHRRTCRQMEEFAKWQV